MDFSFSYAVFRYVKDAQKDLAVPVGVALWSADAKFVRFRLAEKSDKTVELVKPKIFLISTLWSASFENGSIGNSSRTRKSKCHRKATTGGDRSARF